MGNHRLHEINNRIVKIAGLSELSPKISIYKKQLDFTLPYLRWWVNISSTPLKSKNPYPVSKVATGSSQNPL
jgi:hypothetical protein